MYVLAITYCNIFWDILCKNVSSFWLNLIKILKRKLNLIKIFIKNNDKIYMRILLISLRSVHDQLIINLIRKLIFRY